MRPAGWRAGPLLLLALVTSLAITPAARAGHPDLPPPKLVKLQKLFDREVRPLGLHVTRGMLQNLETYRADPEGTHLALYVEPIQPGYTDAQYVANFTKLTRRFVPSVFERWTDLETFDICQEPVNDPREVPPPTTQIFVARSALDRVGNWKRVTLAELLAASPRVRDISAGYYVYFAPELLDEPTLAAAAAKAGWTSATTAYGH